MVCIKKIFIAIWVSFIQPEPGERSFGYIVWVVFTIVTLDIIPTGKQKQKSAYVHKKKLN